MANMAARAYNGGLRAEPTAGSRVRVPSQGAKPPEAESLLAFVRPRETANLAFFPYRRWISYIVKPRPNYKQELER